MITDFSSLFETPLYELGRSADLLRRQLHGDVVTYRRNLHLNPTNECRFACPLCAFSRPKGAGYLLSVDEMYHRIEHHLRDGDGSYRHGMCEEVHLVSAIHPDLPYSWYLDLIRGISRRFSPIRIKAWTAAEIAHFSQWTERSYRSILEEMQAAGLTSLPGGGAEIFAPHIRKIIAPDKISADVWLDIHRTAHELGIPTNATMLFGHLETMEDRLQHLLMLRQLQTESLAATRSQTTVPATTGDLRPPIAKLTSRKAAFESFVPLVFHPSGTKLAEQFGHLRRTSPTDILRTIAVSRLVLDNFPHIKSYWISLGVELSQLALAFGADEYEGPVIEERIHHSAGSTAPQRLTEDDICHLIREAGFTPRDT